MQLMVISDMNPGDGEVACHNFLNLKCMYMQLMVISDMNPGDGEVACHNFLNLRGSFRMFSESPYF